MSTIQSAAWGTTPVSATSSATQQRLSQLLHPEEEQSSEDQDETKTVIERNVVTAGDGSKTIIITSVTINADGSRGEVTPISKMKIGKSDKDCQSSVIDPYKTGESEAKKEPTSGGDSPIKNAAKNQYEQNSITGNYMAGILFQEHT